MTVLSRIPLARPSFARCLRSISTFLVKENTISSPITSFSATPTSHFNQYALRIRVFSNTTIGNLSSNCSVQRPFSTETTLDDRDKEVDEINLKFAEAREEIELAMESKDTVYFDDEAETAREAVKVVIDMFDGLSARLPEDERRALHRSMGLKIEQLKAELKQLDD